MPGHNVSPGVDVGPLRKARDEFGEVFGEEHAAEGAAVQRGQRVEDLPLGLGQGVTQCGDQPRIELEERTYTTSAVGGGRGFPTSR